MRENLKYFFFIKLNILRAMLLTQYTCTKISQQNIGNKLLKVGKK